ncbi:HaeII family restriction endonuclease [Microcystis aeruginosa]|uniref:HaeII family restriction endonuclease n=1 Tax=Microcystis aeruginosa TaxID=1126 RepID=UPI001E2F0CFA|nr:HaeII family restriction endonuclease [Microcystis aeruginosa]MDB9418993.1 HaeII family restriction endonuclease [Microcystis aeruginosa CS-563/04]
MLNKVSTSSARYQHDLWSTTAMSPELLEILDRENKRTGRGVERYIYLKFSERQATVSSLIAYIDSQNEKSFDLKYLLDEFSAKAGIRRSIDKAYEIIADSLFETIVVSLEAEITISIPLIKQDLWFFCTCYAITNTGLDE